MTGLNLSQILLLGIIALVAYYAYVKFVPTSAQIGGGSPLIDHGIDKRIDDAMAPQEHFVGLQSTPTTPVVPTNKAGLVKLNTNVVAPPQPSNLADLSNDLHQSNYAAAGGPSDIVRAEELLPQPGLWADSNPEVNNPLNNMNFLDAGYHIGTTTTSQSNKNPNLQLRSDPVIPKVNVGPWNQSTIERDSNRRAFEIGSSEY